jgi:hypothetical protein
MLPNCMDCHSNQAKYYAISGYRCSECHVSYLSNENRLLTIEIDKLNRALVKASVLIWRKAKDDHRTPAEILRDLVE